MLDRISTAKMSREEWLEERRKSIGGSDAAAVDRVMGPISKGAARMQHGVQHHGDELDAFQLESVERMLAENKDDKT